MLRFELIVLCSVFMKVECSDSTEGSSVGELCKQWWKDDDCKSPISFSAIIDLYAADKIGNESYLPINEVRYGIFTLFIILHLFFNFPK